MLSLFLTLVIALASLHVAPLDGVGGGTGGTNPPPHTSATPSPLDGVGGGTGGTGGH